jgi:hypothetical protein
VKRQALLVFLAEFDAILSGSFDAILAILSGTLSAVTTKVTVILMTTQI